MNRLRRTALLTAGLTTALLLAQGANAQTGQWYQVFSPEIERTIGRRVHVDAASVAPGGLGRTFSEADVLLRANRQYPRGTVIQSQRSVDCTGGRVATLSTQVLGPTGAALGTFADGTVHRINWDSQDGKVLKFVCQGILPR
jgi:hypothetical protein